mgnify:CR=1
MIICAIVQTYDGMIVGEHSRDTDLDVRKYISLNCLLVSIPLTVMQMIVVAYHRLIQ